MDFSVSNHGSIFLLQPLTFAGRAWVRVAGPLFTEIHDLRTEVLTQLHPRRV